jgi:hypothetical protein
MLRRGNSQDTLIAEDCVELYNFDDLFREGTLG